MPIEGFQLVPFYILSITIEQKHVPKLLFLPFLSLVMILYNLCFVIPVRLSHGKKKLYLLTYLLKSCGEK